ncbi:glutathione S-transferase-like [Mya arenaria]|uniref:glutathione S-transferase-like n=1 Tax=Mya arenaria TaxID=6604 RepID=UPI0022E3D302|nr:glutathione S-transferase-like [Mya arenaria]
MGDSRKGCYVSVLTGVCIAFIAVGVGLIVQYVNYRTSECVCPETSKSSKQSDGIGMLRPNAKVSHDYKLFYFDCRGRGEIARMIFAYAGHPFVDKRIDYDEEWPSIKYDFPQYVLPVLEIDGSKNITQSMAIARHLSREFDIYGKTPTEQTVIDEITETVADIYNFALEFQVAPTSQERAQKKAEFYKVDCPKFLMFLENLVAETGQNGFAVGDSFTVADLMLFVYIEHTEAHFTPPDAPMLKNYSLLDRNRKLVSSISRIPEYLQKRPEQDL